ncbi:uncharacterized protein LOC132266964 [Cornus florida]|uniref:uncharacterized protein LOC132266964 n=1 Tax=Cornus florida TaxID=4283 RepID=UPI00289680A0|nr:uncharacterized protein LOC132266964 [Cornus florida]
MAIDSSNEKWVPPNSPENEVQDEEEEEEEALSLCDLPINEEKQSRKQESKPAQPEEDFDFSSLGGGSVLTESEMCVADEVFFRGQILPFRHSISSEPGLSLSGSRNSCRNPSGSVSRSESMDHYYSGGGFTSFSSRSSSVRSYHSSSSGSTSTIPTTKSTTHNKPPKPRNQFHSHPSPTPRIRVSGPRPGNVPRSKSTAWSFFKVGLVRTPEIELQDLKFRGINNIGSRNNSRNSNSNSNSNDNDNENESKIRKKKKQLRLFDRNGGALFGGCKCSVNSTVDQTVHQYPKYSRIVLRKSKSVNEISSSEKIVEQEIKEETMKKTKQAMSRHRTFEWLKELSLSGIGVPVEA